MAKDKAVREEELYKVYTADSLYFIITKYIGVKGMKRYSEILFPVPVDDRNPGEIARERAQKMGLKVV